MMLPEYVSMLPELESNHNRVKRPVLDMAQAEDMEKVICEAMEFKNPVQLFQPLPFVNSLHKIRFRCVDSNS
ncbi:YolD-like family protein [Bacillus swezeyi]|uniref:Uncharacterized protein n=1 Tax=Bacillus swezeyi TaxID=1925020 RepID=A0A5M8S2H7_9BACI|nr:YolD-like family protein [Bacillus swezeyi]KAA6453626.1 hypothetical protein DX927_03310 [Bacillus swezeyi]TYS38985.1 YolD-like family protein [Bacillus swezeyi]